MGRHLVGEVGPAQELRGVVRHQVQLGRHPAPELLSLVTAWVLGQLGTAALSRSVTSEEVCRSTAVKVRAGHRESLCCWRRPVHTRTGRLCTLAVFKYFYLLRPLTSLSDTMDTTAPVIIVLNECYCLHSVIAIAIQAAKK